MAEMLEASCMLKTATSRSLLIVDEVGRGTSSAEGFGIAKAIAKEIIYEKKSFALFATHFHEMTSIENDSSTVANYHLDAEIKNGRLKMNYEIKPGPVDKSYGLYVMKMVNFPEEIISKVEAVW